MLTFRSSVIAMALLLSAAIVQAGLFDLDEQPTSHTKSRQQYHGFSVKPPSAPGWYVRISEQTPVHAIYRRHLATKTHTFFASVSFGEFDKSVQVDDALVPNFVSEPERTEVLENSHQTDESRPTRCIRYTIRYRDKHAPNSTGAVLVTIDRGFVCAHPTIPGAGIRASFSERGLEGELDSSLWSELEDFLKGVHIESAPGTPVA
jgi:hypothetical protein